MLIGAMKSLPGILSESRSKDIYGWKKVYHFNEGEFCNSYESSIAKLIIPKDAAVIFTNHKCRASYAIVDGFYPSDLLFPPNTSDKKLTIKLAFSAWDNSFYYEDGKTVTPDSFDPDPDRECSHGIHFFRTFDEAVNYLF